MLNLKRFILVTSILGITVFNQVNAVAEVAQKKDGAIDKKFEEQMDKYLASDKGQENIGRAFEQYIKVRQEKARKDQEDKAAADLESQFKNPVKIDIGNSPFKGPANAKVTVIEFSDFQCPFCKRGKQIVEEIIKAYPNDVKVAFKNLPLPMHAQAEPAALAALAAHKQGKFWEMHDALFDSQQDMGKGDAEYFNNLAQKIGLDVAKFKTDMASPELKKAVEEDKEIAQKNGIQGTPGFFVNGVAVKGAYPFEHFKKIIDRWLAGGAKQDASADKGKA